jgi:hypothetical protein
MDNLPLQANNLTHHLTGGDGDLFKARPGRLDKPGYAPTAIGYGLAILEKSLLSGVRFYFVDYYFVTHEGHLLLPSDISLCHEHRP